MQLMNDRGKRKNTCLLNNILSLKNMYLKMYGHNFQNN